MQDTHSLPSAVKGAVRVLNPVRNRVNPSRPAVRERQTPRQQGGRSADKTGVGRSPSLLVDRDLLMRLLSRFLPLVEAALATSALLDRYDSYAEVIAAPLEELRQVAGLGEHGASILRCVYEAAIHLATAPLRLATGVSDWASLSAYLNTSMARERNEVFRVLFLNSKNHLIADEVLAQGTTNAVHVSVRDIAQRSLQHGATSLLLLHNHPSGDPAPSPDDWEMTRIIESALTLLGIHLHDHVIVGKERFFSLKSMRLIHASPMKAAAA